MRLIGVVNLMGFSFFYYPTQLLVGRWCYSHNTYSLCTLNFTLYKIVDIL